MEIIKSEESLELVKKIAETVHTFHPYHHILWDVAKQFGDKPITYVEIGCYAGASACLMLQRPNTTVISIDYGKPIIPKIAIENINANIKHGNTHTYVCGDSRFISTRQSLIDALKEHWIDILFIDGGHDFQTAMDDFINYNYLVNKGGFIIFDDYDEVGVSPGVPKAVDHMNATGVFVGFKLRERFTNEYILEKCF
jgi:predicted O-methyltransferase YrrM